MGLGRAVAALVFILLAVETHLLGRSRALVDSVNLVFHEAGHVFFAPLGRVIGVLGGSLFEVGLPAALVALALRQGHWTAAGGCLVWLSTAFRSVSIYAGDAEARALPLLGGRAVVHDWWFLLSRWGALDRTEEVALAFRLAGLAAAVAGTGFLILGLVRAPGWRAQK